MTPRRKHGKRALVTRLAKVRVAITRVYDRTIERDAKMELAHALLSVKQARRFVMNAERLTARTLAVFLIACAALVGCAQPSLDPERRMQTSWNSVTVDTMHIRDDSGNVRLLAVVLNSSGSAVAVVELTNTQQR